MKTNLFFLFSFLLGLSVLAQAPSSFTYQSILRDGSGKVMSDTNVSIGVSVRDEASVEIFSETHNVTTNANGLVNLAIGSINKTLNEVDWGSGSYFITLFIDGVEMGSSQLLSVPYAMYSNKAKISESIDPSTGGTDYSNKEELQNTGLVQYPDINLAATYHTSTKDDPNMSSFILYKGGTGTVSATAMTTDFIPVKEGMDYQVIYQAKGTMAVVFYDEFKRVKRGFDINDAVEGWSNTGGKFTVEEGEVFVRICGWNTTPIELYPLTTVVLDKNAKTDNIYFGKKLLTIGDSISHGKMWQEWLCMLTGLVWDREENDRGKGTHWELLPDRIRLDEYEGGAVERKNAPTALSGTRVKGVYVTPQADWENPIWEAGLEGCSIFERAKDTKYYSPDVIVVWAGANDHGNGDASIGDNSQNAYMGAEVSVSSPVANNITSYSSYKGMLQRLCIDNPNAKILCLSLVPWRYDSEETANSYSAYQVQINTMIEECAKEYHCEYVDLYNKIGWNYFNNHTNYNDIGSGSNREVHPNNTGQFKVAQLIARYLK